LAAAHPNSAGLSRRPFMRTLRLRCLGANSPCWFAANSGKTAGAARANDDGGYTLHPMSPVGTFATWQGTRTKAALGLGADIFARVLLSPFMSSRPSRAQRRQLVGELGHAVGIGDGAHVGLEQAERLAEVATDIDSSETLPCNGAAGPISQRANPCCNNVLRGSTVGAVPGLG
jgi:hypothetical protein